MTEKFRTTIINFSNELGIDINRIFVFDGVSLKIVAVTWDIIRQEMF